MGQKTNPNGLRLGIIRTWDSRWYANSKDVAKLVKEDNVIRKYLNKQYKNAGIAQIEIERIRLKEKEQVSITLHTAKPGMVIGKDGETKNKVVSYLERKTNKTIVLKVVEVRRPEKVASLVAQNIAEQLENRVSFRRAQKYAIQRALRSGAKGVRTMVSGRLGGAEMARSEGYSEGRVPLHTLRADVDYATAEASTTFGLLGVKVWIYHGEVLKGQTIADTRKPFEPRQQAPRRPRRPRGAN